MFIITVEFIDAFTYSFTLKLACLTLDTFLLKGMFDLVMCNKREKFCKLKDDVSVIQICDMF
jgi:hypothetical protein